MAKRKLSSPGGESSSKRARTDSPELSPKEVRVANHFEKQFPGLPTYYHKLKPKTKTELTSAYDEEPRLNKLPDAHLYQDLILARNWYKNYQEWAAASAALGATKYTVGGLADDTLTVAFMEIGNGDCIFIKTPEGHVFVVDCGTRKRPDDAHFQKSIRDIFTKFFLKPASTGAKQNLKAMILTHPDKDHYNEIVPILEPVIDKIEDLFHSLDLRRYNGTAAKEETPTSSTSSTSSTPSTSSSVSTTPVATDPSTVAVTGAEDPLKTLQFLASHAVRKHRVTINSDETLLVTESAAQNKKPPYKPDETTKSITVHKENWHGSTCEIILLAAGLTEDSQSDRKFVAANSRSGTTGTRDRYAHKGIQRRIPGATEENTASIVTLVKGRDKKLLLCGDATYLTELYLLQNHEAEITKVDVAQIEHHGAGTAHGAGIYVEKLDPFFAAVSTGAHGGDNNPRWRVIQKYLGYKKLRSRDTPPQEKRVVRLKDNQKGHVVQVFDESGQALKADLWTPHSSSGIYSTRDNGPIVFTLGSAGEWQYGQATRVTT
jgi:beta-lactamase superfamily II metal-dependent hydrolase